MREKFGAKKEKSQKLRFHTQTGGSTLTAQQPDNNIIRVTIQALAAVLGGTQSLHTNSRDEALALPSEDAVRTALRTQQIIAHESGVANTIDPLAGSYYLEALTDEITREVYVYLDKIEKMGGMVKAIEKGYIQKEIQDSAYRYQKEVEAGEKVVVGVNSYKTETGLPSDLLKVDPRVQELQLKKLAEVKKNRDNSKVASVLGKLKNAAEDENANLIPVILEGVKEYAAMGEICDVLRGVFGEYKEAVVL